MKPLLTAFLLIIVATLFMKEKIKSVAPDPANPANAKVDSLLKAYQYPFEQWSVNPYYGVQWSNGETRKTASIQAKFTTSEAGFLADKKKLNEFSDKFVALIIPEIRNAGTFQEMKVQFEERNSVWLFTSTNSVSYIYSLTKADKP